MMEPAKTAATDIPTDHWIDRYAPRAARPYLRLARIDRPIGAWLLLLPCWWGMTLASPGLTNVAQLVPFFVLFGVGSLVMRGAGCTVNDIADRDFDAQVARTSTRPIASGAVSLPRAVAFIVLQLLIGLGILLSFNRFTIALGVVSLALVFAYPFMKRITFWPQAFLGLTFNWGALMGFAAVTGSLAPPVLALYAGGIAWTLGYDTVYAHQDKEDDARLGLKSSALKLGDATRPYLFLFYGLTIALMALAGHLAAIGWPYYVFLGLGAAQLFWQAGRVDFDNPGDCLAKFRSNRIFGWIVLAGLIAGQLTNRGL